MPEFSYRNSKLEMASIFSYGVIFHTLSGRHIEVTERHAAEDYANTLKEPSDIPFPLAETELNVLSSQCLSRRIPDKETLASKVRAWQEYRNKHNATANWQFPAQDAGIKLNRLYPAI